MLEIKMIDGVVEIIDTEKIKKERKKYIPGSSESNDGKPLKSKPGQSRNKKCNCNSGKKFKYCCGKT